MWLEIFKLYHTDLLVKFLEKENILKLQVAGVYCVTEKANL